MISMKNSMKKELRSAARALVKGLQSRSLPGVQLVEGDLPIWETNTRGYGTSLGSLSRSRSLELWLDRFLGRPEPFFWFGFVATHPKPIQELVDASPEWLIPKVSLGSDDIEEVDGSESVLSRGLTDKDLEKVIREDYLHGTFFLGKYDRAYAPFKNGSRLDVSRAATFLEEVAIAFKKKQERPPDIERKAEVERAAINAVKKHYHEYNIKSVEKDNVGWDLEAKRDGISLCLARIMQHRLADVV
jgi:hypothetical protein